MLREGETFQSDSGRRYRVGKQITVGGQAVAYLVTEVTSGEKWVLKAFHERFNNDDTRTRIRFIMEQDLKRACPAIEPPVEILDTGDILGHYTPFVGERALEDHLKKPEFTLIDAMQLAIAVVHALVVMNRLGLAYGDIHPGNFRITRSGLVFEVSVIDLDNYIAAGLPPPPCIGQNLYLAPELRIALEKGSPAIPSVETDRFALGVLMHEILLLCHPASGNDHSGEAFNKAMCSGVWLFDPAGGSPPKGLVGGYPPTVLNAELAGLFRSAFSLDAAKRPSAEVWEAALLRAYSSIFCCPKRGCLFAIDGSKTTCPQCGYAFPPLSLRIKRGRKAIPLTGGSMVIGRSDLGGSQMVSARHAVFRRIGPETWIESIGMNGTFCWVDSGWNRIPDGQSVLLESGDRLRLADVEVQVK